jgi:hypothetical protein
MQCVELWPSGVTSMSGTIKFTGYGLLAGGIVLTGIYLLGVAYLKGDAAFNAALNPFVMANYLALAPLAPGAFLIWLADRVGAD